jgi:hypothetical protein
MNSEDPNLDRYSEFTDPDPGGQLFKDPQDPAPDPQQCCQVTSETIVYGTGIPGS